MSYVFDPAPVASVPVLGRAERFPVHRIYCVGRNYAAHVAWASGGRPWSESVGGAVGGVQRCAPTAVRMTMNDSDPNQRRAGTIAVSRMS